LIEALTHWSGSVRGIAAEALGKIGDTRAVEPLIGLLKDRSSTLGVLLRKPPMIVPREDASRALGRITGQDFGIDAEKWQEWWTRNKKH
jgi:HEAT repeat protein